MSGGALWAPQRGLGRRPSRNRIWRILAFKCHIWWLQFQWFSWESTDQISTKQASFSAKEASFLRQRSPKGEAAAWSAYSWIRAWLHRENFEAICLSPVATPLPIWNPWLRLWWYKLLTEGDFRFIVLMWQRVLSGWTVSVQTGLGRWSVSASIIALVNVYCLWSSTCINIFYYFIVIAPLICNPSVTDIKTRKKCRNA